jgi:hypothetical protein
MKLLPDSPSVPRNAFRAMWVTLAVCLLLSCVPHRITLDLSPIGLEKNVYVFFWAEVWNVAFHLDRLERAVFHLQLMQLIEYGSYVFILAFLGGFALPTRHQRESNSHDGIGP